MEFKKIFINIFYANQKVANYPKKRGDFFPLFIYAYIYLFITIFFLSFFPDNDKYYKAQRQEGRQGKTRHKREKHRKMKKSGGAAAAEKKRVRRSPGALQSSSRDSNSDAPPKVPPPPRHPHSFVPDLGFQGLDLGWFFTITNR